MNGPAATRDSGITLIEVLVSLTLMSIVMALSTTGMLEIYRGTHRTEAAGVAQTQLNVTFIRLDKEIRYAAGISTPGTVGGNAYVEYLTANGAGSVCTELRLVVSTGTLQTRFWTQGTTPLVPSGWKPLAEGVTGAQPFTFVPADATFNFQRLRLNATVVTPAGRDTVTKQTLVEFTALNTSLATSSATVCTEGRVVP